MCGVYLNKTYGCFDVLRPLKTHILPYVFQTKGTFTAKQYMNQGIQAKVFLASFFVCVFFGFAVCMYCEKALIIAYESLMVEVKIHVFVDEFVGT